MENKNLELTDGVVILKPFEIKDASLHLAGEDTEQEKWLSGGKSTIETVKNWIKKNQEYWQNNGPIFNLAIWTDNKLIGMIEANTDKEGVEGMKDGQANISYGIYSKYRGMGYAKKAVNLLVEFLKSKNIKQALIRINQDNVNSLRIPIACGFKQEAEIKSKDGNTLKVFVKDL